LLGTEKSDAMKRRKRKKKIAEGDFEMPKREMWSVRAEMRETHGQKGPLIKVEKRVCAREREEKEEREKKRIMVHNK
jgi:hypothetical protein